MLICADGAVAIDTCRVACAGGPPLQYAVWPVNTNTVEQPASSVTVSVAV
jgi:hypothetical protein